MSIRKYSGRILPKRMYAKPFALKLSSLPSMVVVPSARVIVQALEISRRGYFRRLLIFGRDSI
ncbi:MAG: hypothetical protein SO015_04935 [Wujia sp.]|nr:hypothetical protein [Wujia sp.]MDD7282416.1 hypothetical protein [Clostridium sp.]MDY3727486.1 hypothetical protein [Wujia sp.]